MTTMPSARPTPDRRSSRAPWRKPGLAAAVFAGPAGIGYVQPVLGAALAVIVVSTIAAVCLTLLIVALRGTPETTERVFRLLRMISGRAEPPGPQQQISPDPGWGRLSSRSTPRHDDTPRNKAKRPAQPHQRS